MYFFNFLRARFLGVLSLAANFCANNTSVEIAVAIPWRILGDSTNQDSCVEPAEHAGETGNNGDRRKSIGLPFRPIAGITAHSAVNRFR